DGTKWTQTDLPKDLKERREFHGEAEFYCLDGLVKMLSPSSVSIYETSLLARDQKLREEESKWRLEFGKLYKTTTTSEMACVESDLAQCDALIGHVKPIHRDPKQMDKKEDVKEKDQKIDAMGMKYLIDVYSNGGCIPELNTPLDQTEYSHTTYP